MAQGRCMSAKHSAPVDAHSIFAYFAIIPYYDLEIKQKFSSRL
jgi:hypothetical protein